MHPLTGRVLAVLFAVARDRGEPRGRNSGGQGDRRRHLGVREARRTGMHRRRRPGWRLEPCAGLRPRGPRARQAARHAFDLQSRFRIQAVHGIRAPAARAARQAQARRSGREVPAGTFGECAGRDAAPPRAPHGRAQGLHRAADDEGARRCRRRDHSRGRSRARPADETERGAGRRVRLQQHGLFPAGRRDRARQRPVARGILRGSRSSSRLA